MKYPPLSELEPEQLKAINEAKSKGSSIFRKWWITYILAQQNSKSVVMARDEIWNDAWYISTWSFGLHYALEVPVNFRNKWIGSVLLKTKQSLDGILSFDWTDLYSHVFFLIKHGYIPTHKLNTDYLSFTDLSERDLEILIEKLQIFKCNWFKHGEIDDISPIIVRLRHSPKKASIFRQQNNF